MAAPTMRIEEREWDWPALSFADDAVLLDEWEWKLQQLANEFGTVCERRKLRVFEVKSKIIVFERGRNMQLLIS